jgi:phosphoribosyl 1,2-cyclic phosphodiesterase
MNAAISVRFWGVRGSIACPGPDTVRYGGNTPCVEVRCGDQVVIFDGGTGLRALGNALVKAPGRLDADIFFSHCHHDHVGGLPFFAPFYVAGNRFRLWAGNLLPDTNVSEVIHRLMSHPLFPIEVETFKAELEFRDFSAGDVLNPHPAITVRTAPLDHPDGATGYRLEYDGRAVAYLTDTEGRPGAPDPTLVALARGADLVIYDCTYTEEEIVAKAGWGHSTWQRGVRLADAAGAKTFCLFHHNPDHDDAFMARLGAQAAAARPGTIVATEGAVIAL